MENGEGTYTSQKQAALMERGREGRTVCPCQRAAVGEASATPRMSANKRARMVGW